MSTTFRQLRTVRSRLFISRSNLRYITSHATSDVKSFDEIPGPLHLPFGIGSSWRYWPIIGTTTRPDEYYHAIDNYSKYGPIWKETSGFMQDPIVVLCLAEDIEAYTRTESSSPFRSNCYSFTKAREASSYFDKREGVFSLQGDDWRHLRSKVQPTVMKPHNCRLFLESTNSVVDDFIQNRLVQLLDEDGNVPNSFGQEIHKWALESITMVSLHQRLGLLESESNKDSDGELIRKTNIKIFQMFYLLDRGSQLWRKYPTKLIKRFSQQNEDILRFLSKYISLTYKEFKENPAELPPSILANLLNQDVEFEDAALFSIESIMGGGDTTGHTAAYALYELSTNPDVQEKLYEELKLHLSNKGSHVTVDSVEKLKYIKACIKETLRLHPVVSGIFRKTTTDHVFSGYHVPKGTSIIGSTYVTSRLEQYYPNPLQFKPERWTKEHKDAGRNNYATLPFGYGPRTCIGKRIAEQELTVFLSKIIRRFKVSYSEGTVDCLNRLVLSPENKLRFKFVERDK